MDYPSFIVKIRFSENLIISNILKNLSPVFHIFENKFQIILISFDKQPIIPYFKNPKQASVLLWTMHKNRALARTSRPIA